MLTSNAHCAYDDNSKHEVHVEMKTEVGKANIAKVQGGYHVRIREGLGYSSPRPARTRVEAERIAAKLEAGYAARLLRLASRNEAQS